MISMEKILKVGKWSDNQMIDFIFVTIPMDDFIYIFLLFMSLVLAWSGSASQLALYLPISKANLKVA